MKIEQIFKDILEMAAAHQASHVHVKADEPVFFRVDGNIEKADTRPVSADEILSFIGETSSMDVFAKWQKSRRVDFEYFLESIGRFRVHVFMQRGLPSAIFQSVKSDTPGFEDLALSESRMKQICQTENGLILLCSNTLSGRNATAAAMLDYINQTAKKHILCIEDPIEYSFTDENSIFTQREIGIDAESFEMATREAVYENADVVFVSSLRGSSGSMENILRLAERGSLVICGVAAHNAVSAIQQVGKLVPAFKKQFSSMLRFCLAQYPVTALSGKTIFAQEVFANNGLGRKFVEDDDVARLTALIESGRDGNAALVQSVQELFAENKISKEDALSLINGK